jgi:phosphatidylserine/phosphatidylglycerophosphate/cardiolipin synthase-like enzyme
MPGMRKKLSIGALVVGVILLQALNLLREPTGWGSVKASPLTDTTAEILGVYFTPPAGAAAAIVKAIDQSQREVLVQAYGFTHNAIAQSLLRAKARGVTVHVLLDQKSEHTNRYVIDLLNQAQLSMRADGKHAISHNKVMVIDASIVITGSFNFTNSAETRNAENFLILKSVDLANQYKQQWLSHWAHSVE